MPPILGPHSEKSEPSFIEAYRRTAQDFARPVAVLACMRGSSQHAITVDSFLDVSYDPPTIAVSVYSGSRMAESLGRVTAFTLSVLASDQKGVAQWLGEPGQPLRGILDTVDTVDAPSGSPIIAGCAAWFDLQVVQRTDIATHELLIGEVTACSVITTPPPPLVHWAGGYHQPAPR